MKKIVLLLSFMALSVSCTDDITALNENKKDVTTAKAEFLFTSGQKALVDQMVETSVNLNVFRLFSQHWAETTYPDESQYNITTRNIPDAHFRVIYKDALKDLKEAKDILAKEVYTGTPAQIADQETVRSNKNAVIDIMMAYGFHVLVDTFGDVPYTQSLDLEKYPQPKYDDALTIYKDLIAKLTAASTTLTTGAGAGSFGAQDLIYGGDDAHWAKFANSLRIRLAVNLTDVDATYSSAQITAAVAAGAFTSNADNANLQYLNSQPNANPVYVSLVASGRHDFIPANTLVNMMNTLADPRRAKYFTNYPAGSTTYKGGVYGASNSYTKFSHVAAAIEEPNFAGTILDYAEIEFLLAEAAAKGVAVGTPVSHYNNAILASMANWGVDATVAANYLATVPYDAVNYKKSIGEQSWIALYNRGFEAWSSFRRLDYPLLKAPVAAYNGLPSVPTRYSYPAREETLNAANVAEAIARTTNLTAGNTLISKIFWDKN